MKMEEIIMRAHLTWASMPTWAKVADGLITVGLIAATVWLL